MATGVPGHHAVAQLPLGQPLDGEREVGATENALDAA